MIRFVRSWAVALSSLLLAMTPRAAAQDTPQTLDRSHVDNAAAGLATGALGAITDRDPMTPTPTMPTCEPLTIARGEISRYGLGADGFLGEELIIRSPVAWAALWAAHTDGMSPRPPLPPVNFDQFVVLAAVQGPQPSGAGPNITIAGIERVGDIAHVIVVDDERPGMLAIVTNPYHFVAVDRNCLPCNVSIGFRHVAPRDDSGLLVGRVVTTAANSSERVPVVGARVTLLTANAEQPFRSVLTGFDGTYVIANVPAAFWYVRCDAQGFVSQTSDVTIEVGGTSVRNFELLRAPPPPGSIRGRTWTIAANSTQQVILPGVRVLLFGANANDPITSTTSNDQGVYEFGNVVPGNYRVRGVKDGFQTAEETVVVVSGRQATRDLVLRPAAPTTGGIRGVTQTIGANGTTIPVPLPGVRVQIIRAGSTVVVADVTSNAQGVYEIAGLAPGAYIAHGTKDGFLAAEAPVAVVAGQQSPRDLLLLPVPPPPPGGIRGRTLTDGAAPADPPAVLPAARVQLFRTDTNTQVAEVQSGAAGVYEFGQLAPGGYRLRATKDGYQVAEAQVVVASNQVATVDLLLHRNTTVTRGNLTGSVVTVQSNTLPPTPVVGAVVKLRRAGAATVVAERVTNADGFFAFEQFEQGSYTVEVTASGFASRIVPASIAGGQTTNLLIVLSPAP